MIDANIFVALPSCNLKKLFFYWLIVAWIHPALLIIVHFYFHFTLEKDFTFFKKCISSVSYHYNEQSFPYLYL